MLTTATPAFRGCFCQQLLPVADEGENCCTGETCRGSWERTKWAGTGGGRGHTCRPVQAKTVPYDTSTENQREGLESGSSLLQDRTGPVGASLLSYGHYPKGTEWDSQNPELGETQNWVDEFARYQFREDTPPPPPPKVNHVLHFWGGVKEKRRRRRQEERVKEEKE